MSNFPNNFDMDNSLSSEKKGESSKDKEQSAQFMKHVQLSSKSKTFLILRVLLICFCCIYIPMQTILYRKLEEIETDHLVSFFTSVVSSDIRKEKWYYYLNQVLIELMSGEEAIMIYTSLIYIFFPFIALKLVFVINLLSYSINIVQCIYQSRRPFWAETETAQQSNPFCITSYASPSGHFFINTFIFLYSIVSIRLVNKKKKLSPLKKGILFLLYFILIGVNSFILLVNKINFIYQMTFGWIISLLMICWLLDMDNKIHNFIFRSLKNLYKTRKYKMKIFFYVLSLTLISVIVFSFSAHDNLNSIEDNLFYNPNCGYHSIEEVGMKSTFLEVAYIFGIIGAFWGASLTVEHDCGQWWKGSALNFFIKISLVVCFILLFHYLMSFTDNLTFELRFLMYCFKNMFRYYIVMGIFPLLFDYLKMNEKTVPVKSKTRSKGTIFQKSIFSDNKKMPLMKEMDIDDSNENRKSLKDDDYQDGIQAKGVSNKERISDLDQDDETTEMNKKNKAKIYQKSTIVTNLQKHSGDERYEFVKDENHNEQLYLTFNKGFIEEVDEENQED